MLAGDRGGGREQSGASTARGVRHHQRVLVGAAAALPSDAQRDLGREELHHHIPAADRDAHPFHAQRRQQRRRPQGGVGEENGRRAVVSAGHARRLGRRTGA